MEEKKEEIIQETKPEKIKPKAPEKTKEEKFREMLKKTSFGTSLREALETIAQGGSGALIVISEPNQVKKIMKGGFKINCKFNPERLVELSKMDGAIIIDSHLKKILYANVLLTPEANIPSMETGTRHQAAERTGKQINQLVIAVSKKTGLISLYSGEIKYTLRNIGTLITRLQSVLETLEEQKKIFSSLANYLNVLEFTNLVTAVNVVSVVQKAELIIRGSRIAKKYINELGSESQLLELKLKEISKNVEEDMTLIIKDYCSGRQPKSIINQLSKMSYDSLLDLNNILKALKFPSLEEQLQPKGCRMLSKIASLNDLQAEILTSKFQNLKSLLDANVDNIKMIKGIGEKKAEAIKEELDKLKNSALLSQTI
jgi:diadenylate cyclase